MDESDNEIPQPTCEESKSIKAISKDNVHRICSGQVVLSLAVAVKELVENSLDAGSTLVEVKLVQQGLETVEVIDNGSGVEDKNLEGLAAKYHTSKLKDFIDLQTVETFGFRGEALSSLCALANITISTRHNQTDVGTKIFLDYNGKIKSQTQCARSVGTTVTVTNLFETLPVRRKDFEKNIKKEFNKMCQILHAYCLVSKGVRIICTNQAAKGQRTVVMQTHGSTEVQANICAVFGNRQTSDILNVVCPLKDSNDKTKDEATLLAEIQMEIGDAFQITKDEIEQLADGRIKLEGLISSCSHGKGRSSRDRQFFYVNARPCESKNISKAVNDIYHRYNPHQFPFIYLNITTDRKLVDINLTPDKRQLLLNNEKILLALIRRALIATFETIPSTYKFQNTTLTSVITSSLQGAKEDEIKEVPQVSTHRFMDVLSQWKRTGVTDDAPPRATPYKRKFVEEITERTLKMQKIQEFFKESETTTSDKCKEENSSRARETVVDIHKEDETNSADKCIKLIPFSACKSNETISQLKMSDDLDGAGELISNAIKLENVPQLKLEDDESKNFLNAIEFDEHDPEQYISKSKCNEMNASLSEIELLLNAEENLSKNKHAQVKLERLRFKSGINPTENITAEAELQKEISKLHFEQMEILGQFNLGFIIVKLESDLFIVDQHATDEKYNFETLQRTTQLHHQPLAIAQPLDLTAVNEMVLLDHLPVFEKNGFKFNINPDAAPTKKVHLLGKPISKNWEFGKEDIDELIFMLQDAPEGTMCRPSRIRSMFASRSCRMSVMIGQALKKSTMQRLVRHMGEIEQPWNCPHGRPTMRHLINIAMLLDDDDEEAVAE